MSELICSILDGLRPGGVHHGRLITRVMDRLGHDRRQVIDPTRISQELGWQPRQGFEVGLTRIALVSAAERLVPAPGPTA